MMAFIVLAAILGFLAGFCICAILVVGQRSGLAGHVNLDDGWHVVNVDGTVGELV